MGYKDHPQRYQLTTGSVTPQVVTSFECLVPSWDTIRPPWYFYRVPSQGASPPSPFYIEQPPGILFRCLGRRFCVSGGGCCDSKPRLEGVEGWSGKALDICQLGSDPSGDKAGEFSGDLVLVRRDNFSGIWILEKNMVVSCWRNGKCFLLSGGSTYCVRV